MEESFDFSPKSFDSSQELSDSSQESFNSVQEKDDFYWPHKAILLLLTLYKEQEHQFRSGKVTLNKFYNTIACQLRKRNYNVTGIRCKTKIASLKSTYKSIRNHSLKSSNNNRGWRYFHIIDEIFNKKWVPSVLTLDSSNIILLPPKSSIRFGNKRSLSSYKSEVHLKRSRRLSTLDRVIMIAEQSSVDRKKMHEETMAQQDKLLNILQKIADK